LEDIISSLEKSEKMVEGVEDVKLDILYIGSPRYRLILVAPNYKVAEEVLKSAAQSAVELIENKGGSGNFIRSKDGK
jgi:translation initiation factor 2 subunit 1